MFHKRLLGIAAALLVARAPMGMMGSSSAGDAARGPAEAASTPSSSSFTAVQQLGLELEARKVPVETIVVDHVEKTPKDN